jgi:predicted ATPase/DNA-binding CsgD family transcriptional regulator
MAVGELVGRDREVAALAAMVGDEAVRLVTVTGPAGVGKTRVAYAVAARSERDRGLRVVRVELGPLGDPALVADAIAAAGTGERTRGQETLAAAATALGAARVLLVLDNFEHLAAAAGDVAWLLDACPRLTVLVTSRHVLGLTVERMFPLAPLALPEPGERDVARAGRCAAVALFVMRAQARDPSFELTAEVAPAVSEVCRRLDGLPLAIELVAACVGTLPPPALVARWDDVVALDVGGAPDLPPRQRTLRRALDWSYELLDPEEQALLRRLAAFPGGFDLAVVEAACRGDGGALPALALRPLPALAGLVDKSLVERDGGPADEPRYWQLVTVRGYLREHLAARCEQDAADRLMAETTAALAREPDQYVGAGGSRASLDRLERELNNLHAALHLLVRADPSRAVELAANLFGFWRTRHPREGREWLERALAAAGEELPTLVRARGLWAAALLAAILGDEAALRRLAAAGLAAARESGDQVALGRALYAEGRMALADVDDAAAGVYFRESAALCERLGDRFCGAAANNDLGELARRAGDLGEAATHYERALVLWRAVGDDAGIALSAHNLAQTMVAAGDLDRAGLLIAETVAATSDLGHGRLRAVALAALATSAAAREPRLAVATLYGAAEAELEAGGVSLDPLDAEPFCETGAVLSAALGPERFAAESARGRALGAADLRRLVERITRPADAAAAGPLTPRELDVVRLIAAGLTNREIAERLVLSDHTVHRHVANILRKLDVRSRAAAVSLATRTDLL